MSYDLQVPNELKRTQQWFGSIIGRPIDEDSRMDHISPSGESMEIEAAKYIAPSPALRPAQRIQIYNQQYWWRLLGILQEGFPFLTRLMGFYDFNRHLGIPYLVKYPPNHWSLFHLGARLPQWVKEEYHAKNREMILHGAEIDWVFNLSFVVEQLPPLTSELIATPENLEKILENRIYAQKHIELFQLPGDLFQLRDTLLQHPPEHWQNHPSPPCEKSEKNLYFIVYRNLRNEISWKEISAGEYHLLMLLKKGTTIDEACEWLEEQQSTLCDEVEQHLIEWFQDWTMRGWLSIHG